MSFEIKNENGESMTLVSLDEQASKFWNVPIGKRHYSTPEGMSQSWFDSIGWLIHCHNLSSFADVIAKLNERNQDDDGKVVSSYWEPYIDLCIFWKQKGYQPIYVR